MPDNDFFHGDRPAAASPNAPPTATAAKSTDLKPLSAPVVGTPPHPPVAGSDNLEALSSPKAFEGEQGLPLPPAFYPTRPLLPSADDLAFLSTLPTPCARSVDGLFAQSAARKASPGNDSGPRTPLSPSGTHTARSPRLRGAPSSPPPSAQRPMPPTSPQPGAKRPAPASDPSSTPPASPPAGAETTPDQPAQTGPATSGFPALGSERLAEDYSIPDPHGTLLGCHRKLWTGTLASGTRLSRSDTWALGRGWRRHVRVITGMVNEPTAVDPGQDLEAELGSGVGRQSTW